MEQIGKLRSTESSYCNSVPVFVMKRMGHLQSQGEFPKGQIAEETQNWKTLKAKPKSIEPR